MKDYNERMSIVTRTGDQGSTSLYHGERVPKHHPRIEAVGTLDELNAVLAFCDLPDLQCMIFEVGAVVANPDSTQTLTEELHEIERAIEVLEPTLPPLRKFILPGGTERSKHLHLARTVCRRAERLFTQIPELPADALPFINRLSDYLFLLAREDNIKHGVDEPVWNSKGTL